MKVTLRFQNSRGFTSAREPRLRCIRTQQKRHRDGSEVQVSRRVCTRHFIPRSWKNLQRYADCRFLACPFWSSARRIRIFQMSLEGNPLSMFRESPRRWLLYTYTSIGSISVEFALSWEPTGMRLSAYREQYLAEEDPWGQAAAVTSTSGRDPGLSLGMPLG
jgi:hypothetical protein